MNNALKQPQTIVVLGGTSEIGRAIAHELLSPSTRAVVLACRNPEGVDTTPFQQAGVDVSVVAFDAADTVTHQQFVDDLAKNVGDIDVAIAAFGVLGSQDEFDANPAAAVAAATTNYTGAVSICLTLAARMRAQRHGHIVVLSSVAGERARASNFVYGSTKAGVDAFAQGLGDSLAGTGVRVTVVRPGFVHSRMTEGLAAAPFATQPEVVAALTVKGMRAGRHTVWAPGILRYVFMTLRHVPRPIFRRLPLG
ncbi:MAG TPA: decaprenylphospho-beta-D-erythro-pentofuranosid-2-ulose 2-reductase [Ilumatobacter sp.]|nr:decaprenylphospho-beta-D-erythro-pentofuranosid-2-ulose 2-reductase [Ilumatobacter sp.]